MSRSTCNVERRITRSSEALESDDSHIGEERLQKRLTNVKEHHPPRNIFNNVQEVPKLRRSVVARAVRNVVCSTPMPTEKKRDFFYAENSLNISPIDPICEEVVINEDKDVQNNEQNEYKECNKEVKVILTRTSLPIVISDSEDEKEEQNVLKERQNQDIKKSVDCKIHYNTGSELKINIENLQLQNNEITKNIPNTTQMSLRNRSHSKTDSSRNTLSIKKKQPLQQIKCSNKKDSKQTELDSLKNESINLNAPEKHSNFEQTQYKSPKSNNLINQNVDTDPNASTVPQAENISIQTSLHNVSRFLRSSNCIADPQNNCEQLQSVISSPDKIDTPQDNTNLMKNGNVTDQCVNSIIRTRSQNLSAANISERDESKVLVEEVIGSSVNNNVDKQEKHVSYKSQSSQKSNCENKTIEKVISCEDISKNEVTRNECNTQHQKKISSRKLYFTSKDEDKDIEHTLAMIPRNEIIPETAKEITKLSRIPISRSRSKSKDKNLDSNTKKKNISSLATEEENSNENCILYKSPPKRPPRNKAQKKRLPMVQNIPKINKDSSHNLQNKSGEGRDIDKIDEPLRQSDSDGTKYTTNKELPTVITTKKLDHSSLSQVEGKEVITELRNDSNLNNVQNKEDEIIEKYINPEKTVEIGTSPVNFTPDKNDDASTHVRELVEAGTSTCKFDSDRDIFRGIDNEKAEKLTQLILKLTQRHQNSSFHVDNSVSQTESQKNNPNLLEKDKDLSELLPDSKDKQVRVTMTNKEVQTSVIKMSPSRNKKKSSETGPGKKSVRLDREDLSKSSILTECSDIIKDYDESRNRNPHALFHSVEKCSVNFSSSDEEPSEDSFANILENGPWRIDEDLDIFPRRSSYKLNFLRSARDIEMERLSQGLRNQSDSLLETTETGYKKPSVSSRTNNAVYAKRNKVQIYSRATNENNFQSRGLQAAAVANPSSSPGSVMSDLVITESDSDRDNQSNKQNGEGLLLTNKNCQSVGNSKNKNSDETNADVMALVQSNTKDVPEHDNLGDENPELPLKCSFSVAKGGTHTLKPNEEDTSSIYNIRTKTNDRGIKKQNSKSNRGNSIIENAVDSDDEILAVPLEDTNSPATEQTSVRTKESSLKTLNEVDKIVNSKAALHSNTEELEHVIKSPPSTLPIRKQRTSLNKNSVVNKSVNARAQKSRSRKIIPENDDGVLSTTVDPEDVTGLRRSGRERKPVQRRFYCGFATSSERVMEYYKGLCGEIIQSSIPAVFSKLRTKKNDKKANNDASNKQSGKIRGKRERNKKMNNIKPQSSNVKANKDISDVLGQNSRQTDDLSSNRLEIQGAAIDEVASTTANCSSDIMIRKTSKRQTEENDDSLPNATHVPNKKNKPPASKEDGQDKNIKECRVSPRKSKANNSSSSEIIDSNTNIDADNITNNNNTIKDIEDYIRASQLHGEQNRDFAHQSLTNDNLNSVEEFTGVTKAIEKDCGRSTMLKNITFDESNVKNTRPLTGRISKNYKRKDKVCTKISKVLSRSINTSREHEIANDNGSNVDSYLAANNDMDVRSRRASILQSRAVDSQHINLLINDNVVSMKYVEKDVKFKLIQDNLMVSEGLKNVKNGGTMGYLKLPPACQKSLHIARKFALFYAVIEGEGFIQVHNKTSHIGKLNTFVIPVGVEYSIVNTSREDALVLVFVKMPDPCR